MLKFLSNLFDENKRKLNEYQKAVDQINDLEPKLKKLTDTQLASQTDKFRDQIDKVRAQVEPGNAEAMEQAEKNILNELLPEAFATVREVSRRVLGMRHYDVQLIGGYALHTGRIAEMKTGEGKTLVATLAAYLNGLGGKGVHVVTVNDYLAHREIGRAHV